MVISINQIYIYEYKLYIYIYRIRAFLQHRSSHDMTLSEYDEYIYVVASNEYMMGAFGYVALRVVCFMKSRNSRHFVCIL